MSGSEEFSLSTSERGFGGVGGKQRWERRPAGTGIQGSTAGQDGTILGRTEPSASPYVTFWVCFVFVLPPLRVDVLLVVFSSAGSQHLADPLPVLQPLL